MTKQMPEAARASDAEPAAPEPEMVCWKQLPGLTDAQWARVEAALPGRVGARAHNGGTARRFVSAVLWVARNNLRWCDVPAGYGHWHTIYIRYGRWCEEGLWPRVIAALDGQPEAQSALRDMVERYSAGLDARRARRRLRSERAVA
ncbi:MAG: transposase [Pseudoxanthomonas sp.]